MIEPRHRTIVDIESKTFIRLTAEREPDRGPDGTAMRDRDDVPARLLGVDALDGAANAVIEVHETLAAGRGFVEVSKPVAADRPARQERRAIEALPLTEMLLGERVDMRHVRRLGKARGPDRVCGLMRALQITCIPDGAARQ